MPQVEVSPLENAIQVVENKNQELRALIGQYQHKQAHGNVSLLSMCLNGVIDAAVNGGIARYQEVSRPRGSPRRGRPRAALLRLQPTPLARPALPQPPQDGFELPTPWFCGPAVRTWGGGRISFHSRLCQVGSPSDHGGMLGGLQEEPWSPVLHKK